MMVRTQISLEAELQRHARRRATDLGVSFAEYIRRLVARDLNRDGSPANPALVFDLGSPCGSNVTREKGRMIAEAFAGISPCRKSARTR